MKRIIVLILISLCYINLFSQKKEPKFPSLDGPIYSINNGIIETTPFWSEYIEPKNLTYKTPKEIDTLNIGATTYSIRVAKDELGHAGDFHIIQIYKGDELITTYKSDDGIVRYNNPNNYYAGKFKKYSENNYFIKHSISRDSKLICFLGQHYPTDPAYLILFIATEKEIKLVFNNQEAINRLTINGNNIEFLLHETIENYSDNIITARIFTKNGVLNFEHLK